MSLFATRIVAPWLVVAHCADGVRITGHATKDEAKRLGGELRHAGLDVFVYDRRTAMLVGVVTAPAYVEAA